MQDDDLLLERLKESKHCTCRACHHFHRVNFDGVKNVSNRQGFCILGMLEGDYTLFISSSLSKECTGFLFSERNFQISKAEDELKGDLKEFQNSVKDRRTRNYQLLKPLLKQHEAFFQACQKSPGMANFLADQKIQILAAELFRDLHKDKFLEVYKMVQLKKADYRKFLAQVSVEIHDRFCDCHSIEFNPAPIPAQPEEPDVIPGTQKALLLESMGLFDPKKEA